jgi:hypothetical protein
MKGRALGKPPIIEGPQEYELGGRRFVVGDRVSIEGLPGTYRIMKFNLPKGYVECYGGKNKLVGTRTVDPTRLREEGATTKKAATKVGQRADTNPIRAAIVEHGRVEVEVPESFGPVEVRKLKNSLFNQAYALGLKGKFKITKSADGKLLVGERTDTT